MAKPQISKPGFYHIEINKSDWSLPERYQDLKAIGSGAFGMVCSALDTLTNTRVAIKKLSRPFQGEIHAQRAFREICILGHLNHDNVIGLLDVFTPSSSAEDMADVYLVSELMACDLGSVIKNQVYQATHNNGQTKMTDNHIQFYIYQILRALKYVHSAGIIHRDLKPSNIAIDLDNGLRVLDFGLARQSDTMMSGYVTTRWYRAPEILLSWMKYNYTVDIWSVGCILAELLTGKVLFEGKDALHQLEVTMQVTGKPGQTVLSKITSKDAREYVANQKAPSKPEFKKIFKGHNPLAIDLLEKMLELDPDVRITAEEALGHPYLSNYGDPDDEPLCPTEYIDKTADEKNIDIPQWKNHIFGAIENFVPHPARTE